jgi:hypothetical protein
MKIFFDFLWFLFIAFLSIIMPAGLVYLAGAYAKLSWKWIVLIEADERLAVAGGLLFIWMVFLWLATKWHHEPEDDRRKK